MGGTWSPVSVRNVIGAALQASGFSARLGGSELLNVEHPVRVIIRAPGACGEFVVTVARVIPACYGKPADSLAHSYQLQRTTPNVYYRCRNCGIGRYR